MKRRITAMTKSRFNLGLILSLAIWASASAAPQNSPSRPGALEKYNQYLNKLKNLKADLSQISPNGVEDRGALYIEKPGKLRLIYHTRPQELLSDGKFLTQYDWRNRDSDSVHLKDTPLSFLLYEGKLDQLALVQRIVSHGKWTEIVLKSKEDPDAGLISLIFQESPLQLIRWILTDSRGNRTVVTLSKIQTNVTFGPETFKMVNPPSPK